MSGCLKTAAGLKIAKFIPRMVAYVTSGGSSVQYHKFYSVRSAPYRST